MTNFRNRQPFLYSFFLFFISLGFTYLIGFTTDIKFINDVGNFILAIFIGFFVIWNVTPALHAPLMSVTNAISGIISVGCMVSMTHLKHENTYLPLYSLIGFFGLFFASINIFGGFVVL